MGIYHDDLQFRNTIKISEIIEIGDNFKIIETFKIIDFDYAFVVKKIPDIKFNAKCYEYTQSIIEFWLYFDYSKE